VTAAGLTTRAAGPAREDAAPPPRPIRVAQVTPSLRGGGLERLVRDLAVELRRAGHVPAVFCTNGLGTYADELRAVGIEVHDCREGRLRVRGYPSRLLSALRAFAPDVIHAHSGTWLPAAVARRVLRAPRLVFTDHGRYPPEPRLRALVERWCWRSTDGMVAVTAALAEYVRGHLHLPRAPEVILNGVDLAPYASPDPASRARLRAEWGVSPDDVLAVAVGRFAPVKNYAGMLHAVARAAARAPALRLAILGSGPLEADARAEAARLGIAERVRFLGFRRDVAACLLAADLFVNSSDTEALPVSLLEAMAAGLPTAAPRIGGIPDALLGPEGAPPAAGIVVPAGDMDALGDALARLTTDAPLRRALGARARERARDFSLEAFAARYGALYTTVLGRTG
jgi:glycosyltransferase involved in cell wall biosynthesis